MKKILLILLASILLVGCSSTPETATEPIEDSDAKATPEATYMMDAFMKDELQAWLYGWDSNPSLEMQVMNVFVTEKGNITAYNIGDPEKDPKYYVKDFAGKTDKEIASMAAQIDKDIQQAVIDSGEKTISDTPITPEARPIEFLTYKNADFPRQTGPVYKIVAPYAIWAEEGHEEYRRDALSYVTSCAGASEPFTMEGDGHLYNGFKCYLTGYLIRETDEVYAVEEDPTSKCLEIPDNVNFPAAESYMFSGTMEEACGLGAVPILDWDSYPLKYKDQ